MIESKDDVKAIKHENRRLIWALKRIADLENYSDYRNGYEPLLDGAIEIAKKAVDG